MAALFISKRGSATMLMRAIVTGPTRGQRPAALSLGGKALTSNKDGSFNLETRHIVELFGKGYHVEPVRGSAPSMVRHATRSRSVYRDYVSEMTRAAARR